MLTRTERRERDRALKKYSEVCACCHFPFAVKSCAVTYTGTYDGKWVVICHDCHRGRPLDHLSAVGVYYNGNPNSPAYLQAMEVIRDLQGQGML